MSIQFGEKNVVGCHVKGLNEVQIDNTTGFSLACLCYPPRWGGTPSWNFLQKRKALLDFPFLVEIPIETFFVLCLLPVADGPWPSWPHPYTPRAVADTPGGRSAQHRTQAESTHTRWGHAGLLGGKYEIRSAPSLPKRRGSPRGMRERQVAARPFPKHSTVASRRGTKADGPPELPSRGVTSSQPPSQRRAR